LQGEQTAGNELFFDGINSKAKGLQRCGTQHGLLTLLGERDRDGEGFAVNREQGCAGIPLKEPAIG